MKNKVLSAWNTFSSNFRLAPFELQIFFVFCALVTIFELLILAFLPKAIKEAIIPVTGWNSVVPYGFNFGILGSFLLNRQSKVKKINIQYGNIIMLSIAIVFALYDQITWKGGYEDNPYLFRSPWRPVWKIAIPLIWIIVLLSPRIKKYEQILQNS